MYNVKFTMYNEYKMRKSVPNAFTLIELLVVISIIAVIGIYALSNYRTFGEDKKLNNSVLDVISLLRQAQTNAATNVICAGGTWQVKFADTKTINLKCSTSPVAKTLQLDQNILISLVSGNHLNCPAVPPPSFAITFETLTGKINLVNPNCTALTVTLTNNTNTNTNTKSLIIEQGGRIYAQ